MEQVRELKNTTLYGSRTLFFLTPHGTLRPLAIELTCPPMDGKPQWKEVFKPTGNSTAVWLWKLAKANVLAHDSCYHQLMTHWYSFSSLVFPVRSLTFFSVHIFVPVISSKLQEKSTPFIRHFSTNNGSCLFILKTINHWETDN